MQSNNIDYRTFELENRAMSCSMACSVSREPAAAVAPSCSTCALECRTIFSNHPPLHRLRVTESHTPRGIGRIDAIVQKADNALRAGDEGLIKEHILLRLDVGMYLEKSCGDPVCFECLTLDLAYDPRY